MEKPCKLSNMTMEELEAIAWHEVSVPILARQCNPFGCWPEIGSPIKRKEVLECIKQGQAELVDTPTWPMLASGKSDVTPEENRQRHIKKIAWFVQNQATDPIHIDVGVPSMGAHPSHLVEDGNHRLAAAIIRKDRHIKCQVSGSLDEAMERGLWAPNKAFKELEKRWEERDRPRRRASP